MAEIRNLGDMTVAQLKQEVSDGGKFVIFSYTISLLVITFKRSSDIYFIRGNESTIKYSLGLTLLTLLLGWWGIPWGPIYTVGSLFTNLKGGKNITAEIMQQYET